MNDVMSLNCNILSVKHLLITQQIPQVLQDDKR